MWPKSSSVSTINLAKKIYYSTRDIEFFLGGHFFTGNSCVNRTVVRVAELAAVHVA